VDCRVDRAHDPLAGGQRSLSRWTPTGGGRVRRRWGRTVKNRTLSADTASPSASTARRAGWDEPQSYVPPPRVPRSTTASGVRFSWKQQLVSPPPCAAGSPRAAPGPAGLLGRRASVFQSRPVISGAVLVGVEEQPYAPRNCQAERERGALTAGLIVGESHGWSPPRVVCTLSPGPVKPRPIRR